MSSKNIILEGATYNGVESITLPTSGGGSATFNEVSDTTAIAEDVASGKFFYNASGVLTEGTASGGGGGALKIGVLRPDAELWQSWTYDKLVVADEGITLPTYKTTAQTLKSSQNLPAIALDCNNYDYAILERSIANPIYNTETVGQGRAEYTVNVSYRELAETPPNTISVGSKSFATRSVQLLNTSYSRAVYWQSATAINVSQSVYGFYCGHLAPTLSGTNITIRQPSLNMRGETSVLNSTYYSYVTDVRYQYIIELYRVPKNNEYFDGFNLKSLGMHTIACAQSASGDLT